MPQPDKHGGSAPEGSEDALRDVLSAVRDMLSRGVVMSADRLRETFDEAVREGRMTREDAERLIGRLVQLGRREAHDALADLEALVGRSARGTRRLARARVAGVAAATRHAKGTDRALRAVDRARRAAGLGSPFPISGYEDLTATQVKSRLVELTAAELRKVRDHERRNANRKTVLAAIEKGLR